MKRPTRRLWFVVKLLIAVAIIVAVTMHFSKLITTEVWQNAPLQFEWHWLVLAAGMYLLAQMVWGTFWLQLLWQQGAPISWLAGMRVYLMSQVGKYVPGKALVILLRIGLLRGSQMSPTLIGLTATYETLTNMAAGALLAVLLLPWAGVFGDLSWGRTLALLAFAGLPVGLVILHRLTLHLAKKALDFQHYRGPNFLLLCRGFLQAMLGWLFLAASLWCVQQAWPASASPMSLEAGLRNLAAISISYVIGFVLIITPGGLGAREAVLQQILEHQLTGIQAAGHAALLAVMLRLLWTFAEVLLSGSLWLGMFWQTPKILSHQSPTTPPTEEMHQDEQQSTHSE